MSPQQLEAIALFDDIASSDELRLDWVLEPGDIQLLHNHQIVHTRSEYVDFEVRAACRLKPTFWSRSLSDH